MALDVKIIQHTDYLHVVVTGDYDMRDAIDKFPLVLSTCRLTGITKVLVDFRDINGVPAATEKILYTYGIVEHYNQYISHGGREIKFAFVGQSPQVSTFEPGKQIARNGNIPLYIGTDIDEALEWLNVQPT